MNNSIKTKKKNIYYRFCCSFVDVVGWWWCLWNDIEEECCCTLTFDDCCIDEVIICGCSFFLNIDGGCGDGERRVKNDGSLLSFVGGADEEIVPLTRGMGGVEE